MSSSSFGVALQLLAHAVQFGDHRRVDGVAGVGPVQGDDHAVRRAPRPQGLVRRVSRALIRAPEHRDALADAHAQGRQPPAGALAFHAAEQGEQDAGAGAAQRVAEGDGAAVGVDAVLVELQPPDDRRAPGRRRPR